MGTCTEGAGLSVVDSGAPDGDKGAVEFTWGSVGRTSNGALGVTSTSFVLTTGSDEVDVVDLSDEPRNRVSIKEGKSS